MGTIPEQTISAKDYLYMMPSIIQSRVQVYNDKKYTVTMCTCLTVSMVSIDLLDNFSTTPRGFEFELFGCLVIFIKPQLLGERRTTIGWVILFT